MPNVKVNARGAIVFHVATPCPIGELRTVLNILGYEKDLKQSPLACLRKAERQVSGGSNKRAIFARKKPKVNGIQVHRVLRGDQEVETTPDHGARVTESGSIRVDGLDYEHSQTLRDALQGAFDTAMETATAGMIGAILNGLIEETNGTRTIGGRVHWIPPSAIDRWVQIEEAFSQIGTAVAVVTHEFDRTIGSLVIGRFREDIRAQVEKIVTDMDEKRLNESQCEVRARQAAGILEQIEEYASALDADLDDLKRIATLAKMAAVQAGSVAMPVLSVPNLTPALALV
jgi:hypothetical protein